MTDADQDGAALYRRTVLAPLFAAARHHNAHYRRLDLAHAIALHEAGVLSRDDAAALLRGILRLVGALALDGRQDAGDFEDLFFLRENRLQALIGEDLAGRLHAGRSRNDIEATVFRLQMRERMGVLADGLAVLTGTMLDIAAREASTIILAYTHQQPAQPTTYGHYLAAFAEVLLRDLRRLHHAMDDLDACPLGAAAITTTGFPLDRARLAALLGFAAPQENSYGCIAGVYQCAAAYSALRLLALNIGRFTQDLAFWTSFEVGQAVAGDGFVQISSIMPQKRNPLAVEHLRTMASLCAGHCETVLGALHNTPFADMVDAEGPTQAAGLAAFDMAARLLPLLEGFLAALRIDEARARRNIDAACATMTEFCDSLVRIEGLPFRLAHEICADLARRLLAAGRGMAGLDDAMLATAFATHAGRPPTMDPAALTQLASPEHAIAVRERFGGPGPAALRRGLAGYGAILGGLRRDQAAAAARAAAVEPALLAEVAAIAGRVG